MLLHPTSPTDPEILGLTRGLITYLRTLVGRSPQQQALNALHADPHLWLDNCRSALQLTSGPTILEAEFVPVTGPPPLPSALEGLLPTTWDDPSGQEPTLLTADDDTPAKTEFSPAVRKAFKDWLSRWHKWADDERTAERSRALYSTLEQLSRKVEQLADTHELVIGFGLLAVRIDGTSRVFRHLLTMEATLVVDAASDTVRVEVPLSSRIQREDLDFLTGSGPFRRERAAAQQFDTMLEEIGPFSSEMDEWLDRWGRNCWSQPLAIDPTQWSPPASDATDEAQLSLAPALVVRKRDRGGLAAFYDRISEYLRQPDAAAPVGLAQLVIALEPAERLRWLQETSGHSGILTNSDPLLPLAANDEQRDVLEVLRTDTAAVVQGPPGTGKTHTIANLICALLADGQRILITSQKGQALRVLREKLPPAVRDLCVVMGGMQRSGIDELDRSITRLSDLQAATNVNRLKEEIRQLRDRRAQLRDRINRTTADLLVVRGQEHTHHPVAVDGYAGTLQDLVRALRAGQEHHDWIGGLPVGAEPCSPISNHEALELLRLLHETGPQRAARGRQVFPEDHLLVEVDELADARAAIADADAALGNDHELVTPLLDADTRLMGEVERLLDEAADSLWRCGLSEIIGTWDQQDWRHAAVEARLSRRNPAYWAALQADVTEALHHEDVRKVVQERDGAVQMAAEANASRERLLGQAKKLRGYLVRKGRLRRLLPAQEHLDAGEFLRVCTVDGLPPTTLPALDAAIGYLQAELVVDSVLEEWSAQGVPVVAGSLRRRLAQLRDISSSMTAIDALIAARDAVEQTLRQAGIRHHIRGGTQWDQTVRLVRAAPVVAKARAARRLLDDAAGQLVAFSRRSGAAPETAMLAAALTEHNLGAYATAVAKLIEGRADHYAEQHSHELLARLRAAHPTLATSLQANPQEPGWQSRLARIEAAWSWAAALAYYRVARQMDGEDEYEKALTQAELQHITATEELAGKQALLHCLARINPDQRQALQAYRSHVARYGKGKSGQKHRQSTAIRDAMGAAQAAVPAWVMPLSVVADTVPPEPASFDVIIVDEASQASIDSLFLLWLAPRVIVVGDEKQCAPPPGNDLDDAAALRDRYLTDLPPRLREGFEPGMNLYELLAARFPKVIRLSEHFRSMPEIIGWSSEMFYDRRLIPLRQFGADRFDPLRVVHVENAEPEGQSDIRNRAEAEAVADTVQKLVEDPAYRDKTIGVITLMQGTRQGALIENMINDRVEPAVQRHHGIRIGQPPDFQGDERDIILLSMVVTPIRNRPRLPLTTRNHQRRFNVAVTRARDQLWLFTSVRASDLKSEDLRSMLLAYMSHPPATLQFDPQLDDTTRDEPRRQFGSMFEQRVFLDLRSRGYEVLPRFAVGRHQIDLVVVGDRGRLALECETPAKDTTPDQIRERLRRERELQQAGWQFHRLRESEYLDDPRIALEPLWGRLDHLQIDPRSLAPASQQRSRWTPGVLSDEEDG